MTPLRPPSRPPGRLAASGLARFLAARVDRESYLGLRLTLGLAAALLAAWAFGAILKAVLDNAALVRWDLATAARVHAATTPAGLRAFDALTQFGSPVAMGLLALAGAVVLWRTRRRLLLVTWLAAFAGAGALNAVLKLSVHRSRPDYGAAYLYGPSYSFPSGHAMGSTVGFAMLAYVVHRWSAPGRSAVAGARRWWPYAAAVLAVLLIGLSRVYLGVHYPSDVLGGYAAGLAWLAVCATGYGVARGRAAGRDAARRPDPSA